MSADFGQVSDGLSANFGQVSVQQNGENQPLSDGSDRFGQVFITTSPTRTHKRYRENVSKPVQMRPTCPADDWTPESEITADLSATDLTVTLPAIAAFWSDALIHDRAEMRTRWADYRGVVPDALAGVIVSDVEHVRSTSSQFVSFEGGR